MPDDMTRPTGIPSDAPPPEGHAYAPQDPPPTPPEGAAYEPPQKQGFGDSMAAANGAHPDDPAASAGRVSGAAGRVVGYARSHPIQVAVATSAAAGLGLAAMLRR